MDGPGEHYAKWNKSVKERQTPYDFTHMWKENLTWCGGHTIQYTDDVL